MINLSSIRDLTRFKSDGSYVISFYLNVDGAKFPRKQELEIDLKAMIREVEKDWLQTGKLNHRQRQFLERDLERISHFVRFDLNRNHTRGLAIFSCQEENFWQVYPLPVTLPSKVVVGHEPFANILTSIIDQYQRFCTVVIGRRKARIFGFHLGDVEEHFGVLEDDVPAKVNEGEWAGLRQTKIAHHIEDHVLRHLKNVANKTLIFFKMQNFDRLIIGGHKEIISQFVEVLHPYLKERLAETFSAEPDLPMKVVLEKSLECEKKVEKRLETDLIQKITDAERPGGSGVLGLEPTIEALMLGQVHTLVLANGATVGGRVCEKDRIISTYLETCPVCSQSLSNKEDIIEEMVKIGVQQNCQIKYINYNEEFMEKFIVGAILRFAV